MNGDGSTGGAGSGPGSGSGSGAGSGNSGGGAGTGPNKTAPRLVDDTWFRIGVVAGAVGALLLVTHYFDQLLTPGRPAPQQPLRDVPPLSTCADRLSGRPGHSSPSSRLRQNAATVG